MTLFPPTAETDPAIWAAVFAGHVTVGVCLCAALGATVGRRFGNPAVAGAETAIALYAVAWEGLWQRLGAGVADALVDSFAVALGACIAAALWNRAGGVAAGAVTAAVVATWVGIRRRLR